MCDYTYLLTDTSLKGINCPQVLNGIMTRSYSDAYFEYIGLVRNYSGIGISKLG